MPLITKCTISKNYWLNQKLWWLQLYNNAFDDGFGCRFAISNWPKIKFADKNINEKYSSRCRSNKGQREKPSFLTYCNSIISGSCVHEKSLYLHVNSFFAQKLRQNSDERQILIFAKIGFRPKAVNRQIAAIVRFNVYACIIRYIIFTRW